MPGHYGSYANTSERQLNCLSSDWNPGWNPNGFVGHMPALGAQFGTIPTPIIVVQQRHGGRVRGGRRRASNTVPSTPDGDEAVYQARCTRIGTANTRPFHCQQILL